MGYPSYTAPLTAAAGSGITISGGTISLTQPIQIADGTAAAPAYSFTNDTDCGFYRYAANGVAIATGGTGRVFIGSSSVQIDGTLLTASGAVGAPAVASSGDPTTGIYFPAVAQHAVSIAGVQKFLITATGISIVNTLTITGGGIVCQGNTVVSAATGKLQATQLEGVISASVSGTSGNFTVNGGNGVIDCALVSRGTSGGLKLQGNRTAAGAGADIELNSTNTRTANNLVDIQNNNVTKVSFNFDGRQVLIAGNEQTTVGAAGVADALPANPTKYGKLIDSTGAVLVFPLYAAA